MLTDREKEILECLVYGWTIGDCPLFGDMSYQEVCDFLTRLGAEEIAERIVEHLQANIEVRKSSVAVEELLNRKTPTG